ncbi:SDR family oxidoreductase [Xanthomonas rydalmerensis]|uniref:SDR family oxidoreductase n=1 Tax=Xanthomonas rydalmerensis TaxID=3046274 RepID=A0ABZ0JIX2_9XANT|nr:SDR family oxidoreductase [Xanthomonas sp. DM-2023]WOS39759.1 SDR family oxidoreductase [Xanthomonas sp. DM-2023]WOS43943.1 SDR family oxidoreductase [Xanthomonas sp. DM-2023]WOS48123.1 SDR family oxidoreductase [Xanthomonas sp. DM-2023]WOS52302.1 SDR family oxidoreductase [Xanthomonas sp. DM-2023]WOS56486.1 SDR family oxidoreductase [Xanthomonas sp. DM-2023]
MDNSASAAPSSLDNATYGSLRGRRVFITGGGSGIGAALVEAFAAQGAQVAFVDVAAEASAALAERLAAGGLTAPWWRRCDVTDVAALQAAIGAAAAELGDFHVLLNNVGSDDRHALEAVTPEYWERCVSINQRAAFFAIQAVVPGMQRLGGGSIVNLGSTGWQSKTGGYPVYATAKSSVNGLTRGLARDLGAARIRINVLTPGWVMTERQVTLWLDEAGERELARNQCLPDKVMPDDIARMALFLASDEARAITAQEFVVDGGWT